MLFRGYSSPKHLKHDYILFAEVPKPTLLNPTASLLSTAAKLTQRAPAARNTVLTRLSVAHLSISACVVSPSATPASTALSSSDAEAMLFFFSMSLLLIGRMKAKVKGTMLGRSTVAAMLSLKAVELVSSVPAR
jgi:hypothetical protein